jgi:[acyl-carrier-protein] S-malonyltransferase
MPGRTPAPSPTRELASLPPIGPKRIAFVYPGQGTQHVGMGSWFAQIPEGLATLEEASDALRVDILGLAARGPMPLLSATKNAQPVIFAFNAAAQRILGVAGVSPGQVAGHSVGEFNALWAAGVFSFHDALRLVATRARLMERVMSSGAMGAIVGLEVEAVEHLCEEARTTGTVVVALDNAPKHLVVSGIGDAVDRCLAKAIAAGARRATRLATSNAFHSPLMQEALPEWREAVEATPLMPPVIPLAVNTTGAAADSVPLLRQAMIDQLTGQVQWRRSILTLASGGAEIVIECGDSKAIAGFIRWTAPRLRTFSMSDPRKLDLIVAEASRQEMAP